MPFFLMNPFILVQMALYGLPTAIKFVKIKVKAYNEFIAIYYTLLHYYTLLTILSCFSVI